MMNTYLLLTTSIESETPFYKYQIIDAESEQEAQEIAVKNDHYLKIGEEKIDCCLHLFREHYNEAEKTACEIVKSMLKTMNSENNLYRISLDLINLLLQTGQKLAQERKK